MSLFIEARSFSRKMERKPAKTQTARILEGAPKNLALLAKKLRAGELVAVPTETVYGLAANALDPKACARIFAAKRRPSNDPLIVHVHSDRDLPRICVPNATARKLARAFWPGPLTMVLPRTAAVPGVVTAGRDSVAVRMPAHRLFRRLLKLAGTPLAAPSANPFGYVSPTTAEHVYAGLGDRISFILDGGPTAIGLESTIIDLRDETAPRLLRPGAITRDELERALGRRIIAVRRRATKSRAAQMAPGMLHRHYSPHTPVSLHLTLPVRHKRGEAYVYLRRPKVTAAENIFWLDDTGDLRGAARRLFAVLRTLDRAGFKRLHVQTAPARGVGAAINDRLRRAAAR